MVSLPRRRRKKAPSLPLGGSPAVGETDAPMCALYCVAAPAGASLFPSSAHLNPVFGGFGGLSPKEVERAGYLKGAACRNWGLSPKGERGLSPECGGARVAREGLAKLQAALM